MSSKDPSGIEEISALLGEGTRFEGKLAFQGRVRIDGHFTGEIFGDDVLIVGQSARVQAQIQVGTLIVRGGTVQGNICADKLIEVHAPGRILGDVRAPQLYVDKGVVLEGSCRMTPESDNAEPSPAAAESSLQDSRPAN
ncbi:MAG: polymer-forming cytoskeletal protein [Proteobacteria bacterium]|nr:polymer-forming cytoskeletal protein [Pseudomonadota bacterium]